ncbi:hypothetical protein BDL97_12G033200 [Sphagnum fallax]|nr:hypothetical protein BDL97_12G033200 [Sphagnum fallax]
MKTARVEEKEGKGEGRKSPVAGAIAFSEDTTNRRAGEEEVVDVSDEELIAIARSWILRALASAAANEGGGGREDNGHYAKLLSDLRNPRLNSPANASAMCIRLTALAQTVSYLDQNKHQALLMYLLGMSLWLYSEEVVEALLKFVTNLATVSGSFVPQCLDMLVRNFLPPSCGLPAFLDSFTRAGLMTGTFNMEKLRMQASQHIAKKDGVLGHLHSALHQILKLVPTAAFWMQNILVQRMPHRTSGKQWLALYFENLLRLGSSTLDGALGSQILLAVVDRLIEIDVEIRWEDILKEDDSSKVFMFHVNLEDDNHHHGDSAKEADEGTYIVSDLAGPGSEAQHGLVVPQSIHRGDVPTLDEMADKMDMLMDMTFDHLQICIKQYHGNLVFDTLIRSFQTTILDTHKCKFTQFLIFYMCSLDPATYGSRFAVLLYKIFTSKANPPNKQMSAAAYLASYLARAGYLPPFVVLDSVRSLLSWCLSYTKLVEDWRNHSTSSINPSAHGVFYSACQAVMYVLCFRLKGLMDSSQNKKMLQDLPLQELVEHHLEPLTVCLPSVVEEFVKQASLAKLVNCRAWLESKECAEAQITGSFGGEIQLDMFFPFDPYLLRQSNRFIHPIYIQWPMVEVPEIHDDCPEGEEDNKFHKSTFSENPSSSFEEGSLFSPQHLLHSPSTSVGSLDQGFIEESYQEDNKHWDMQKRPQSFAKALFEPGNFNTNASVYKDHEFLDHMSFTPPHELPRMPARLPTSTLPLSFHVRELF